MDNTAASSQHTQDVSRAQRAPKLERAELAGMVAFTALGLWLVYQATELGLFNALGVGPGLFPLVSALILVCFGFAGSVIWATRLLRSRTASDVPTGPGQAGIDSHDSAEGAAPSSPATASDGLDDVNWPRWALAVGLLVAFFVFLDYLGFSVAIGLLVFGQLKLVAARGPLLSAVVAIAAASAIAIGFGELLSVQLPAPEAPFLRWLG